MHRKMSPVTTIFAREKNLCLGKGSFPISVDSFLGLWNRPKYRYDVFDRLVGRTVDNTHDGTIDAEDVYIYEGQNPILQFHKNGTGNLTNADLSRRFLNGPAVDQVFAEEVLSGGSSVETRWLLADNEGTIRDVAVSSARIVRLAPFRLMALANVVTSVANVELNMRVPISPLPTPEPQFNMAPLPPILTRVGLVPAAKPPPLAVHWILPAPPVPRLP
jgi:hypothetical protein